MPSSVEKSDLPSSLESIRAQHSMHDGVMDDRTCVAAPGRRQSVVQPHEESMHHED